MIATRIINAFIVGLTTIALLACGERIAANSMQKIQGGTSSNTINSPAIGNLIVDLMKKYPINKPILYVSQPSIGESECNGYDAMGFKGQICTNSKNDWEALCGSVKLYLDFVIEKPINVQAGIGSAKNHRDALLTVAKNGGAKFIRTEWKEDGGYGVCKIVFNYSGMYEGTSINETLSADVWVMAIGENGEVVAAK